MDRTIAALSSGMPGKEPYEVEGFTVDHHVGLSRTVREESGFSAAEGRVPGESELLKNGDYL